MKKVRATLPQKRWAGLVTKYPAASTYISPDEFSEGSTNFDTNVRGIVTKRLGGVMFGTGSTAFADQFEAIFVDGTRFLLLTDNGTLKYTSGDGTLTSIKSGYTVGANMEFAMHADRVYFCNGVSNAQVLDRTVSYGGAFALPVTLTVVSFAGLAGDTVTVGSTTKTEGVNWTAATSNNATATSLASALSAISGVMASAVGAVITVTSETPSIVRLSDAVNLTIASVTGPRVRDAGAQAPTAALTAAVGAAGSVPAGTYTYKTTFLYYDESESNGGTVSGSVSPGVGSQINLTAIPIGGYGVTARRIYRDDGTSGYRLVLEITNNTATTGTDTSAVGDEFIPTDNGVPPQFKFISHHLDRIWMCGVSGRSSDVFFSEAGQPDVVRSTDFVAANSQDPTTGIDVYQDRPAVFNRTSFGQIYGDTSDTFRYAGVPGTVGCVDNRSIRVRTLSGIPTIMWLSDKGFYIFNGSTVEYISDPIETLVNFNLQQADFSKGSHTDSTQADFTAGTATPGILLSSPSGSITVANPKTTYDTQAAWEAASSFSNLVTKQTATQDPSRIGNPLGHTFDFDAEAAPESANVEVEPTQLTLTSASDNTGETKANGSTSAVISTATENFDICEVAIPVLFARSGTITATGFYLSVQGPTPGAVSSDYRLYSDSFGSPGTLLFNSALSQTWSIEPTPAQNSSPALVWPVTGGVKYWIAVRLDQGAGAASGSLDNIRTIGISASAWSGGAQTYARSSRDNAWSVAVPIFTSGPSVGAVAGHCTFSQTAVVETGTWVSDGINVGFLNSATTANIYLNNVSATYPTGCTSTTFVDASNDSAFGTVDTVSASNLNGAATVSLPRRQYYRTRVQLDTTDDRNVPIYNQLSIGFGSASVWTGATVDHTTDITAMNSLDVVASLPAGTSGTATITKSTDNITYTDQGTFSLANGSQSINLASVTNPTRRYTRVRFNLTSNGNTATAVAQISSATLKTTVVSTFTSADIDTSVTPAGWDIFTTETNTNGGSVAYAMRSSVGGGSGSYVSVTSGAFPSAVSPLRHAQWKAVITATADAVPQIDSVTVGWLISSAASTIRAASLFYNRSYFIAVAETEQTRNNILLTYDQNGKWYRYDGVSIATMGMFFNRPLVTLANTPTVVRWLSGFTDQGTNIGLDIRTKALDFDDPTKTKMLRSITATVENTGATWTFTYSVDGGITFLSLVDYTGATTFITPSDGALSIRKFVPVWPAQISGRTIMIRGVSSDSNEAKFYELAIDAFIREGEPTHG